MSTGPRVLGVDPGTVSFDVCGRDGDRVMLDATLPTADVSARPVSLVDALREAGPVDLVVGPSGYGLPWVHVADVGPRELGLMVLADEDGRSGGTIVGGMGQIIGALKDSGLPVCLPPGVIHLASVPEHRKVNRIDMGTADKLCAVVLGVWDQARRLGIGFRETSFVYVELGGAFTAVIAVQDGAVVDGAGGSAGAMRPTVVDHIGIAVKSIEDALAFWESSLGIKCTGIEEVAEQRVKTAFLPLGDTDVELLEAVVKQVAAAMTVVEAPREILLSGRLSRSPWTLEKLAPRLGRFAPVHRVEGYAQVAGEAAQGAALVGQGLIGGPLAALVDAMALRDAAGTVLDHVHVEGINDVRRRYGCIQPGPPPFWERR